MSGRIYSSIVRPKDGLGQILSKCFLTHIGIYNFSLDLLKNNPSITYNELRDTVFRHIEEKNIQNFHIQVVQNELYYQFKKFNTNRQAGQKLLSSIQYFTLILKDFDNGILSVDESRKKLTFHNHPGYLELEEPLPEISAGSDSNIYLNMSYSAMEDRFQISIFKRKI